MTPDQLARRNAAIRLAWEDPLRLALARKAGSKRSSREAYNAYYREYRKRKKVEEHHDHILTDVCNAESRDILDSSDC